MAEELELLKSARNDASEIMGRRADDRDIVLLASAVVTLCNRVEDLELRERLRTDELLPMKLAIIKMGGKLP